MSNEPTVGIYSSKPAEVVAVQLHPSLKAGVVEKFAPSIRRHSGIDFNGYYEGADDLNRPTAHSPHFSIKTNHGIEYGELWDWLVKDSDGLRIVHEHDFEDTYEFVREADIGQNDYRPVAMRGTVYG